MKAIDLASSDLPEYVLTSALNSNEGLLPYLKIDAYLLYDLWKEDIDKTKEKLCFIGDIDKTLLWYLASTKPFMHVEDIVSYIVAKERIGF